MVAFQNVHICEKTILNIVINVVLGENKMNFLDIAATAGEVCAAIVVVLIIVGTLLWLYKKIRKNKNDTNRRK